MKAPKSRFNILAFTNPRTDTISWRVSGIKRNGQRIRENFADPDEAKLRFTSLEGEYQATVGAAALRATRLSDDQIAIAEAAFKRLERDEDLITAVDHWLRTGKPTTVAESPRLDEALKVYSEWLETTPDLRPLTKVHKLNCLTRFVNSVANVRVTDVLPDHIEKYLNALNVSPDTKEANCKVVSSFFTWCMKGKRHWTVNNPCYAVEIEGTSEDDDREPVVMAVEDCVKLLRAAEGHEKGRMVPYFALGMFGGLRPFEAQRVTWEQVNLVDGEIRLKGSQTKTGKGRTVALPPTLVVWLKAYKGLDEIYRASFATDLREIRTGLGYMHQDNKTGREEGTTLLGVGLPFPPCLWSGSWKTKTKERRYL